MRRILIGLALLGIAGAIAYALWPRSESPAAAEEESTSPGRAAGEAARPSRSSRNEGVVPFGSPGLSQPFTWADGAFVVTVQAAGAPRPGARVTVYWRGARDPNTEAVDWRIAGQGTTDDSGTVKLAAGRGEYLVAAHSAPFAPARRLVARPDGESLTAVTLSLPTGVELSGNTLEKKSRQPVPQVDLTLVPRDPATSTRGARPSAPPEEIASTSSDARGHFVLRGVAPGTYWMVAHAAGHATLGMETRVAERSSPVDVLLASAGVAEGHVRLGDGSPASGAEVTAVAVTRNELPAPVVTGPQGDFSLEMPAGRWRLTARLADRAGALEGVVVSAGGTTSGLELSLEKGGLVEGTISDHRSGKAIAGAHVDVSPHGSSGDCGRAVSDADGGYRTGGLASGAYDVVVNAGGYGESVHRANILAGTPFKLDIALEVDGTLEGTVRDSDGHSLAGVTVRDEDREARTDESGHYQLAGLSPGFRWVAARKQPDSPGVGARVMIRSGETAHADFQLGERGYLEGHVRRAQPGRASEVYCRGGQRNYELVTLEPDDEGSFSQEVLPATYTCWATYLGPRGFGSPKDVTVEAERTATIELVLEDEPDGGVSGRVLEPNGSPSPGAMVVVQVGDDTTLQALSDDEGQFSLDHAPSTGPARVKLSARNGGRTAEQTFDQLPAHLEVTLQESAALRGRVVSRDGTPVSGFTLEARVNSERSSGPQGGVQPFAGDRFELRDLPAAILQVNVTALDGRSGSTTITGIAGQMLDVDIPLDPAATVHGRAVGGSGGPPVSSVNVFTDGAWDAPSVTAADGTFSLPLASGSHRLMWIAPDGSQAMRRVTVTPAQVLDVGDIPLAQPRPATR